MNVIVTGAAGFIGAVLCQRLIEEEHAVLALDNGTRGLNPIKAVLGSRGMFLAHNCEQGLSGPIEKWANLPDVVVHLAAAVGDDAEELERVNVAMTQRLCTDAMNAGARLFVYPTVASVEGPFGPFAVSKELGFIRLREHLGWQQGRVVVLRVYDVIGAYKGLTERRKDDRAFVPALVEARRTGKPVTIFGTDYPESPDGTPARDYVHVLDLVDYLLYVCDRALTGHPFPVERDGAVWVGTGRAITALRLVQLFQDLVGPITWRPGPRLKFEPGKVRCPTVGFQTWRSSRVVERALVDEAEVLLEDRKREGGGRAVGPKP